MASPSDSPSALFDALLQANVDPGLAMKAAEETRIDTFRIEVNARFDNMDTHFDAMQTTMDTRFDAMQTTMDTHYGAIAKAITDLGTRLDRIDNRYNTLTIALVGIFAAAVIAAICKTFFF